MNAKMMIVAPLLLGAALLGGCINDGTDTTSDNGIKGSTASPKAACTLPIDVNSVQVGSMCRYTPGATTDTCSSLGGFQSDTCPAPGLLGCCEVTATPDGGFTEVPVFSCFYYGDAAAVSNPAKTLCNDGTWSTKLPASN